MVSVVKSGFFSSLQQKEEENGKGGKEEDGEREEKKEGKRTPPLFDPLQRGKSSHGSIQDLTGEGGGG